MNSGTETANRLTDHLTYLYIIALAYNSFAGSADMLLKRDDYAGRLGSYSNGQAGSSLLAAFSLMRMNSAGKAM